MSDRTMTVTEVDPTRYGSCNSCLGHASKSLGHANTYEIRMGDSHSALVIRLCYQCILTLVGSVRELRGES